MKRIANYFAKLAVNLKTTVIRFPAVLAALAFICAADFILIENNYSDEEFLIRLIFSGTFAAFLSLCVQFICERVERIDRIKWILRAAVLAASVLYFYFMTSPDTLGAMMSVRLLVCCFALFALILYMPSLKNAADFNKISLVHFKSAFTALLYGVILFLGLTAIYGAIDLLLVDLDNKIPMHLANIVFVFFTPVYYLSLLPYFNSEDEELLKKSENASVYPRFLAILISYIAIPLICAYTAVLIAYFIKILITLKWPVGQIGPMVLIYSAAGFFIYILCGQLDNRFSSLFRKYFPFAQIVSVLLQLVSVFIRLRAYGVTESRYYVTLFGIFSIACSLYLILSKLKKPGMIALLAACFAVFSIIPPVDAFNISRISQTNRVEEILVRNGMLADHILTPASNIPNDDKREITSIIFYMANMGHLNHVEWLPEKYRNDRNIYGNFDQIFGFPPYYGTSETAQERTYINASINTDEAIDINGFDILMKINFNSNISNKNISTPFTLAGRKYAIQQAPSENNEIILSIMDESGSTAIEVPLTALFDQIALNNSDKFVLQPDQMTTELGNNALRVRIVIENVSMEISAANDYANISGTAYVLISQK